jgi:hypothetical protein
MKVQDLREALAQYGVAHRSAIEALNALSGIYPTGAKNPDVVEAFTGCRTHLIEALLWHRYLGQIMTTLSDEGQEALKKHIEAMKAEEAKQTAKERAVRIAEERAAGCVPQEAPAVQEAPVGAPVLKFVTPEA